MLNLGFCLTLNEIKTKKKFQLTDTNQIFDSPISNFYKAKTTSKIKMACLHYTQYSEEN